MRVLAISCAFSLLAVACGGSTAAEEDESATTVDISTEEVAADTAPPETTEVPAETTEASAETTTTEAPAETTTSEAPAETTISVAAATGSQADLDEFCRLTEASDELTSEFFGGDSEPTPAQVAAYFAAQQALMDQMDDIADPAIATEVEQIADGVAGLIDILKDNGFDMEAANDAADVYVAETQLDETQDTIDAFAEANCG